MFSASVLAYIQYNTGLLTPLGWLTASEPKGTGEGEITVQAIAKRRLLLYTTVMFI